MTSNQSAVCSGDFKNAAVASAAEAKQVIIFTSETIISHLHLSRIIPTLSRMGIKPVVVITPETKSPKASIPSLSRFVYFEDYILNDVVLPALESEEGKKLPRLTPTFNELMLKNSCEVHRIYGLKDPVLKEIIDSPATIGALSIYQDAIFKADTINAIKEKGFFWNLHPGVLPQGQGLYVIFWSLMQGNTEHGYTLHEIDQGIDTGKIIAIHKGEIDPEKSVLESYIDFTEGGSDILEQALKAYLQSQTIDFIKPDQAATYYPYPTEDDIAAGADKGIRLWGTPDEMAGVYSRLFGGGDMLKQKIHQAIQAQGQGPVARIAALANI